jgi:hypothetical protein
MKELCTLPWQGGPGHLHCREQGSLASISDKLGLIRTGFAGICTQQDVARREGR